MVGCYVGYGQREVRLHGANMWLYRKMSKNICWTKMTIKGSESFPT